MDRQLGALARTSPVDFVLHSPFSFLLLGLTSLPPSTQYRYPPPTPLIAISATTQLATMSDQRPRRSRFKLDDISPERGDSDHRHGSTSHDRRRSRSPSTRKSDTRRSRSPRDKDRDRQESVSSVASDEKKRAAAEAAKAAAARINAAIQARKAAQPAAAPPVRPVSHTSSYLEVAVADARIRP